MSTSAAITVEADFDRDGTYETDLTTYLSDKATGFRISRGAERGGQLRVGEAQVGLLNSDGTFTPDYSSSSLYGQLRPRVPVRIRATHLSVDYTLFTGFVTGYEHRFEGPGANVCTLQCRDIAWLLDGHSLTYVNAAERTAGEAWTAIATALGLTADQHVFGDGAQTFPLHWVTDQKAVEAFVDVAQSEMGGEFWVDGRGRLRGEGRDRRRGVSRYRIQVMDLDPVAYWRLGEASGTSAADASGNGHTGTYVNTPALGVAGALAGDADTAVTFAGASTEHVTVAHHASLAPGSALSVAAWFQGTTDTAGLVDKGGNTEYLLFVEGGGIPKFRVYKSGVSYDAVGGASVLDGAWHLLTGTYDGTTVRIYVDGVLQATTASVASPITTGTGTLYLGTIGGIVYHLTGTLDEVAIFDFALSAADVTGLWQAGKGYWVWGDNSPAALNIQPDGPIEYELNDQDLVSQVAVEANVFIAGDPTDVIFAMSRSKTNPTADSLLLPSQQVVGPFVFPYLVGGPVETLVTPVATTDYLVNTAIDGTGTDITADLTATVTNLGAGFELTFYNANAAAGYLTHFQLRGLAWSAAQDRPAILAEMTIPGEDIDQGATLPVPFSDDSQATRDYAVQALRTYRWEYPVVGLTFPWLSDPVTAAMLALEVGDLAEFTDRAPTGNAAWVTNVSDWWYVTSLEHEGVGGELPRTRVRLAPSYLWRRLDNCAHDSFARPNASGDLGIADSGDAWADDSGFDLVSGAARANSTAIQVPSIDLGGDAYDQVVEVSWAGL